MYLLPFCEHLFLFAIAEFIFSCIENEVHKSLCENRIRYGGANSSTDLSSNTCFLLHRIMELNSLCKWYWPCKNILFQIICQPVSSIVKTILLWLRYKRSSFQTMRKRCKLKQYNFFILTIKWKQNGIE